MLRAPPPPLPSYPHHPLPNLPPLHTFEIADDDIDQVIGEVCCGLTKPGLDHVAYVAPCPSLLRGVRRQVIVVYRHTITHIPTSSKYTFRVLCFFLALSTLLATYSCQMTTPSGWYSVVSLERRRSGILLPSMSKTSVSSSLTLLCLFVHQTRK